MATIGALQIDLIAETAAFRADLGRAQAALSTTAAQMKQALGEVNGTLVSMRDAAAAVGVAFGVRELASFVTESVRGAAELKNLAVQIGVSTEALQAYRFGAAQSGLAQQELDTGITRLSRTIGEAAKGNDAAVETFRELKVGILDANKQLLPTEEIFRRVASALAAIEDPAKRIRLEVALFGREGARFGALIKDGAVGLDEFKRQAHAAGAVISDELIEKFDESSNRMAVWRIQAQVTAVEAVDYFTRIGAAIGRALDDLNQFYGRWGVYGGMQPKPPEPPPAYSGPLPGAPGLPMPPRARPPVSADTAGNGGLPESESDKRRRLEADALVRSLELERDGAGKTAAEILRLKMARELDLDATIKQGKEIRKYTDAQVAAAVAVQEQIDSQKDLQADINRDRERRDETLALNQAMELQTRQMREQAEAAKLSRVVWDDVSKSYRVNADELAIVNKQQEILNRNLDVTPAEARRMAEAYVEATEKLRSASAAAETDLRRTNAAINEMDGFTERTFDHIGQAMTTAYATGETAADRFRALSLSVVSEIEGEFFKLAAINPLKNWLFGSNSPTLSDVGGLVGKLGGRGGGDLGAGNAVDPALVAMDKGLASTAGGGGQDAGDVVQAVGDQTVAQGDFFKSLGTNVDGALQGLGGFLNEGLMLIVSAVESLAAMGGGGGAGGGLLGLLGLGGGAAAGGGAGVVEAGAATGGEEALLIAAAAGGTDSAPGGPTLVGEQGPEIVNLPRGSQVLPAGVTQTLLGGSGGGDTIIADLRGADVAAVKRLERFVAAMNASLEQRATSAAYDAMRRGGRFRGAFAT